MANINLKLKDLQHIEEKLLKYEADNKFTLNYNQIVILNEELNKIDIKTSHFFSLLAEYEEYINVKHNDLPSNEKYKMISEYSDKLLESYLECNFTKITSYIMHFDELMSYIDDKGNKISIEYQII